MPWWFYVLAVLWSVPIVAIVGVVAYAFISEARRNRRIMAKRDEGEARLSERYLSDVRAIWADHDLGQSSNPRARP